LLVAPEVQQRNVILRTTSKKWVYAQVDSDVPWLRVLTPNVAGAQNAAIGFEIDSSLMDEGRIHDGLLKVVANGGPALAVRVRVDVRAPQRPFTRRLFGSFLTVALLALSYRLLVAVPGDLLARVLSTQVREPAPGSWERWVTPAVEEEGFLRQFVLWAWWVGTLLGAWLLWRRKTRWSDVVSGALAGTMAGVAAAVTVACLLTVVDSVPRYLLAHLFDGNGTSSAWLWTPVWIAVAGLWWAVGGAGAAVVLRAPRPRGRESAGP